MICQYFLHIFDLNGIIGQPSAINNNKNNKI